MSNIRPYIVTDTTTNAERLVQATSQSQARNFVASKQYAVRAASANDVLDLVAKGVKPEVAADEKDAQQ